MDHRQKSVHGTDSAEQHKNRSAGSTPLPAIVSLFSGAGGLDLGFHQEAFHIAVAFDLGAAAVRTHRRNFPASKAVCADLTKLGPTGVLGHVLTKVPIGYPIGIIGGPPCQGFSRANVMPIANDPRNKLPQLYVDIIRELQEYYRVEFIVFENVLGMRDKKYAQFYQDLKSQLKALALEVFEQELCALDFGVPQMRRRIVLTAMRSGSGIRMTAPRKRSGALNVRDALEGLTRPTMFARNLKAEDIALHPNHWTMNPRSPRFQQGRANWSGRSFRRLDWDQPCPTIAFGHREIHVHPDGDRRLSILEAMLLQGFPREFILEGNLSEQVEQVSNAVPPPMARSVASAIRRALRNRR